MGSVGFGLRAACGLAAPDARDPEIMVAGFVGLGARTIAFGSALREALLGRGPARRRGAR
jgi:hypothetical protein